MSKKYKLIPMSDIDEQARKIAVKWVENKLMPEGVAIQQKHKLASDFMNYANDKVQEALEVEKQIGKVQSELMERLTEEAKGFIATFDNTRISIAVERQHKTGQNPVSLKVTLRHSGLTRLDKLREKLDTVIGDQQLEQERKGLKVVYTLKLKELK